MRGWSVTLRTRKTGLTNRFVRKIRQRPKKKKMNACTQCRLRQSPACAECLRTKQPQRRTRWWRRCRSTIRCSPLRRNVKSRHGEKTSNAKTRPRPRSPIITKRWMLQARSQENTETTHLEPVHWLWRIRGFYGLLNQVLKQTNNYWSYKCFQLEFK